MRAWLGRFLLPCLLGGGLAWLGGCGTREPGPSPRAEKPGPLKRIDRALAAARAYLVKHQSADGAWRSDEYAAFRDGTALTPLALRTLQSLPSYSPDEPAFRKGAAFLAGLVRRDGSIEEGENGLPYPVYTAAGAVEVFSRPGLEKYRKARGAWLAYLRKRQLTEDLGWQPADKEYGGWGYSIGPPRKPREEALTESNLSATVAALEALRAAGCPSTDPAFRKALVFVQRCQNFAEDPRRGDPAFDDGGFFFIYDDPARNKAGPAGKDRSGRERFHSYGSTTADGLRCLLACGLAPSHPRVVTARRWLEEHFRADQHPGDFGPGREDKRNAVYFYYARSVALALKAASGPRLRTKKGQVRWAEELADALISCQEADGSWANPNNFFHEDDPLVATCLAASALATCREVLASPSP